MFGFSLIASNKQLDFNNKNIEYNDVIENSNYVVFNQMIEKFSDDKLFYDNSRYVLILDGVVLNKSDLCDVDWPTFVIDCYERNGDSFFSVFRGSFAGALYDKKKKKWIIFTDHLGTKFTYYAYIDGILYCSEMMSMMYTIFMRNNVKYHQDTTGIRLLLSMGFMIEDYTICSEVKKIQPGDYLVFENGDLKVYNYYLIEKKSNYKIDVNCAVDIIDSAFRKAVDRAFSKDTEYGYKHVCALSGGLDCRMTSFVAHEMGYKNQLNVTFSQTNYYDETVPKSITEDLKHEWLFKALDNGIWLYDVDEATTATGGNVIYSGTAHANSLYKYMNFKDLGLFHSGQIGDVIIGSCTTASKEKNTFDLKAAAYSPSQLGNIFPRRRDLIEDPEIGFLYYRAFCGTNNGLQNLYNYTETVSPFCDIEFLNAVLTIPVSLRQHHYIYKKWIFNKYPAAAKYTWEHLGAKLSTPSISIGNKSVAISQIPRVFWNKFIRKTNGIHGKNNMNPIDFYVNNNKDLESFVNSYFSYCDKIEDADLREYVYCIGKGKDNLLKIQALTLLSALKLFY